MVAFQDKPLPYGTISPNKVLFRRNSDTQECPFLIHFTIILNFYIVIYGNINIQFLINIFNLKE